MMSPEDILFLQIHDYLNGDLIGEEKKQFEEMLKDNPTLHAEVEFQQLANTLVINNRLLDVSNTSRETVSKIKKNKTHKRYLLITGLISLASVLGLLTFISNNKEQENITPTKVSEKKVENTPILVSDTSIDDKHLIEISKPQIKTTQTKQNNTIEENKPEKIQKDTIFSKEEHILVKEILKEEKNYPITTQKTELSCENVKIDLKTSVKPACLGENDGSISISSISGGEKPYRTDYYNSYKNKLNSITFVSAGLYFITIVDQNKCEKTFKIEVPEKECETIDAVFNPFIGETWDLREYDKSGTITIYQKNGQKLYEQKVQAFDKFRWDGRNSLGQITDGYFIFVFTFDDGSVVKGEITVTK